jgi:hypothetical protein
VLVRVGGVGVCGSDLLRFAYGTAYHYPLVLGHEFSAVVDEVPDGSRFAPGDKVAVFPLLPREGDPFTQIGEWALGAAYDYFGSRRDGAMAERLWWPEANLVPVPAHVPLVHAAVVEPAAVALHAVRKLRVPAHGSALVIGAGPIGALAAQWLRILGWTKVFVADVDSRKLAPRSPRAARSWLLQASSTFRSDGRIEEPPARSLSALTSREAPAVPNWMVTQRPRCSRRSARTGSATRMRGRSPPVAGSWNTRTSWGSVSATSPSATVRRPASVSFSPGSISRPSTSRAIAVRHRAVSRPISWDRSPTSRTPAAHRRSTTVWKTSSVRE